MIILAINFCNKWNHISKIWLNLTVDANAQTVVRKVNSDDSLAWTTGIAFEPIRRMIATDSNEQNLYVDGNTQPLVICKLQTSDGSIASTYSQ